MRTKALLLCTCALLLSLLVAPCRPQKPNIHWGPQSMMYLKGKHGRRFVSEDEHSALKVLQVLKGLTGLKVLHGGYALLRGTTAGGFPHKLPYSVALHQLSQPSLLILGGNTLTAMQKLQSPDISKRRHIVRSEKVLIHYLQDR